MTDERPNILLFLMDACQAAALEEGSGCLTPNFDRLARRGMRFRRAYCPSPTCSPSRASLMTGVLPHNHGVLEVEHGRDPDQCVLRTDLPHWAQRLAAAGYETGYFGKWHIERSADLEPFGWRTAGVKGAGHHAGLGRGVEPGARDDLLIPEWTRHHSGPPGYRDILHYGVTRQPQEERFPCRTVDRTLEYLERQRDSDGPWCACASFSEPNEALVASEETFARYDPERVPLPANLRDPLEDRPALYRRQQQIGQSLSDAEWRMARTCYFARITELDAAFGRLLDHLETSGQLDDTVLVVTSDHGRYVGGHGFDAHNFGPFEEIYRVPLVVAGPGLAAGEESSALVGFHDLCPTLLDLAGAERIDVPDSRSFAGVLRGERRQGRRGMFAEYHGTRYRLTQRIWWEDDYKFVFNGFDFDELYHLPTDPDEMVNLAGRPEQRGRMERMMGEVWREIRETGDRTLLESHYFSMRMGVAGPG